jgi:hypothetical protein
METVTKPSLLSTLDTRGHFSPSQEQGGAIDREFNFQALKQLPTHHSYFDMNEKLRETQSSQPFSNEFFISKAIGFEPRRPAETQWANRLFQK